jgi:RNA polymerase sigma-70 factor (ECF subfamily)
VLRGPEGIGVCKFKTEGREMATQPAVLLIRETPVCAGLNHAPQISSEDLRVIYTAHYHHVLQICRAFFRQREEAEDAAAEIFLKLYRVMHQKDHTVSLRPWLSQVTRHHCIDTLRRKKREKNSSLEEVDVNNFVDHSSPSALSEILRKEAESQIREGLVRLPKKHRAALVLRYYNRMSYSEIARALNTRLPAVKIMIFRAKRYLRCNLRPPEHAHLRLAKLELS